MSITIRGLSLRYAGTAVPAVDDLGLDIADGELVTLLGPSGSGKSTTLRCIAGLERPDAGVITIRGQTVCDGAAGLWVKPERRQLGMVFQSYAVWPHMSVFDNIAYPLRVQRHDRAAIRARVGLVAELVGLADFLDRQATQLSGGQQQRVALARAIVAEPRAILFDEPLSNLDAKLRERMRRELRALQKQTGLTAIYVTHDQLEAFSISDRIAVMNHGRICQIGTPREIYRRPDDAYVADFLGAANLLLGRVEGSGERPVVRLADLDLELPLDCGTPPQSGHAVQLALRPEDVLVSLRPGPGLVPAEVVDLEYLGSHQALQLRAGATELRAQTGADAGLDRGSTVFVQIPAGAVIQLGSPASHGQEG